MKMYCKVKWYGNDECFRDVRRIVYHMDVSSVVDMERALQKASLELGVPAQDLIVEWFLDDGTPLGERTGIASYIR